MKSGDIDIDVGDRKQVLKYFEHVNASMRKKEQLVKHQTGVYFHKIPVDPITQLSSIDYEQAEQRGYYKIDVLNLSFLNQITSQSDLIRLATTQPNWALLEYQEFVDQLFHIKGHFDIVQKIKPTSVQDLMLVLALIRPGARHLLDQPKHVIEQNIWLPPKDNSYYFKKSHSCGYAHVIVTQMNLICEQALDQSSKV